MAICVGCGLAVNENGVLIVDRAAANDGCLNCTDGDGLSVKVAPNAGVVCTASGLAVDLSISNTGCIGITGGGTAGSPMGISVDRSENGCNGITCQGNGLYSPCPDSLVGAGNMVSYGITFPFVGIMNGPNHYYDSYTDCSSGPNPCVAGGGGAVQQMRFTNPTCCTVEGFWEFIVFGGTINAVSADFDATAFLTTSVNNGGYAENPPTSVKYYGDADKTTFELGGFHAKNYIILGPGATFDVSAKFTIFVATGTCNWVVGPNYEVYVHLTQTGCTCA